VGVVWNGVPSFVWFNSSIYANLVLCVLVVLWSLSLVLACRSFGRRMICGVSPLLSLVLVCWVGWLLPLTVLTLGFVVCRMLCLRRLVRLQGFCLLCVSMPLSCRLWLRLVWRLFFVSPLWLIFAGSGFTFTDIFPQCHSISVLFGCW